MTPITYNRSFTSLCLESKVMHNPTPPNLFNLMLLPVHHLLLPTSFLGRVKLQQGWCYSFPSAELNLNQTIIQAIYFRHTNINFTKTFIRIGIPYLCLSSVFLNLKNSKLLCSYYVNMKEQLQITLIQQCSLSWQEQVCAFFKISKHTLKICTLNGI